MEGSNRVVFQYLDMRGQRGPGTSATVGIERQDGAEGLEYLRDGLPTEHRLANGLVLDMPHSSVVRMTTHTVVFDVRVNATVPPATTITNTATVQDGRASHARSAATRVRSPSFAGSSKTAFPTSLLTGETVTYTLRLTNSGDRGTGAATLMDRLPAGLAYVQGSLSGQGASYNAAQGRIEWQGALEPGQQQQLSYRAQVTLGEVNRAITNTASLTAGGADMGALSAPIRVNAVDLSGSSFQASANEQQAGTIVAYTIRLANSGRYPAAQASLVNGLPGGLALLGETLVGAAYDAASRTIGWRGTLAPGASYQVTYSARLDAGLLNGTLVNNVAVISDGLGASVTRTAAVRVLRADLSASTMSVWPRVRRPGEAVRYTVQISNTGPVATTATLSSRPPDVLSADLPSLYASSGQANWQDGALVWSGTVVPQGLVMVRYDANIPAQAAPQVVTSTATLTDAGGLAVALTSRLSISRNMQFWPLVFRPR
ncbi:MAG: hypothetical protein V1772_06675 [Chloroflexota bacterium]